MTGPVIDISANITVFDLAIQQIKEANFQPSYIYMPFETYKVSGLLQWQKNRSFVHRLNSRTTTVPQLNRIKIVT